MNLASAFVASAEKNKAKPAVFWGEDVYSYELLLRQSYEFDKTRPRLQLNSDNKVVVIGGTRQVLSTDFPPPPKETAAAEPAKPVDENAAAADEADLVLISKIELLPHLPDISIDRIVDSLRRVMPNPKYIAVSARTGEGVDEWIAWLAEQENLQHGTHGQHDQRHMHTTHV